MFYLPKREEIAKARKKRGLSQNQLGKMSLVGTSTINRIERGISGRVGILRAQALAKALRCPFDDLFIRWESENKEAG